MTNKEKIALVEEWVNQISTHGSARHRLLLDVIALAKKGVQYTEEVKESIKALDQVPVQELR